MVFQNFPEKILSLMGKVIAKSYFKPWLPKPRASKTSLNKGSILEQYF
jgi:hypothetical protein